MNRWGALRRPVVAALAALAMTVAIGAPLLIVAIEARNDDRVDHRGILVGDDLLDGASLVTGEDIVFDGEGLIAVSYALYPAGAGEDAPALLEGSDEQGPVFSVDADDISRSVAPGDYDLFATFGFSDGRTERRVATFTLVAP